MKAKLLRVLGAAVVTFVSTAMFVRTSTSAESGSPAPDFSGIWARVGMDPELLPSGPRPLVNLRRPMDDPHVNGGGDPLPLVGDYTNPILRPQAAAAVKKAGELSEGGKINPDPSNQCAPY